MLVVLFPCCNETLVLHPRASASMREAMARMAHAGFKKNQKHIPPFEA